MPDVVVIGGGIAGLTAAWKLRQKDFDVLVLEEKEKAGGNIRTIESEGFRMEIGPHSFMGSSESIWDLIGDLELEEMVEPAGAASNNRYIYRDGRLLPLPMSPGSFLKTPLLSARSKLRLALEPFIPNGARDMETAWDFFRRRFGSEAATFIMSPFVSGIYAGDVKMLGARAAFGKFWNFERESGSMILGAIRYMRQKRKRLAREGIEPRRGLYSFRGGLGRITDKLSHDLGEGVKTGIRVESITRGSDGLIVRGGGREWKTSSVILAIPPSQAPTVVDQILPDVLDLVRSIPMAPVALVHWSPVGNEDRFPSGFGFLMPRLYTHRVLGTIFASQLFSGRAPDGRELFASFYGGIQDPVTADAEDSELEDLIHREHRAIFRNEMERPNIMKILRYPDAIPQLLPDHPEIIDRIEKAAGEVPGLFLAGNYLTGVGMENAVESGYRAADKCTAFLNHRITVKTGAIE